MSFSAAELRVLLQLLPQPERRSPLGDLRPTPAMAASDRARLCRSLAHQGWVTLTETITRFHLAPPGRVLLGLNTANLPLTAEEVWVLRTCGDRSLSPGDLTDRLSLTQAQTLIQGLADRGLVAIQSKEITAVTLTPQALIFLRDEYRPQGTAPLVNGDLLGNYLDFLRSSLSPGAGQQETGEPRASVEGDLAPGASLPGIDPEVDKPTLEQILETIRHLDRELNTDNYLPLYALRERLQPPLSREELDRSLYHLQRQNFIELGSIQDVSYYTPEQLRAGIPQPLGGSLFFISVR